LKKKPTMNQRLYCVVFCERISGGLQSAKKRTHGGRNIACCVEEDGDIDEAYPALWVASIEHIDDAGHHRLSRALVAFERVIEGTYSYEEKVHQRVVDLS
jgi:hypothetical protein